MIDMFSTMGAIAFAAGFIGGVSGFGAGTVQMIILPWFFPLNIAAGISGVICLSLTITMLLRYRKHVKPRKLLLPIIYFLIGSYSAISFSTYVDQVMMKKVMGIFLIFLSIYFLFVRKTKVEKVTELTAFIFSVISGICDGLFGIGGPLMVILFLARSDSKEEYLGNTQLHFTVTLILNCIIRACNGIITLGHSPYMLVGIVGIQLGFLLANRVADRINGEQLKKIVSACVGLAGVVNLIG